MSVADVLSGAATHHVACERAESFIDSLPDGCVSLMTLDFPYYGVKDDAWDNAWPTPEAFLEWMGGVLSQCRRVLAPNGSIYVFASPQMAWGVEGKVREHFAVLNRIAWVKAAGTHRRQHEEACRSYFPQTETVIFAEQSSGLGSTIRGLRGRAGLSTDEVERALGFVDNKGRGSRLCYRWECGDCVPTPEQWGRLLAVLGATGPAYEAACRPFNVSASVPYTDVWTYRTVNTYPGKHLCEKPEDMARNMVRASSRPGGLVADFFCGSGAFLAAAVAEGRRAIGCDMDPHWAEQAQRRCNAAKTTGRVVRTAPAPKHAAQTSLFDIPPRT